MLHHLKTVIHKMVIIISINSLLFGQILLATTLYGRPAYAEEKNSATITSKKVTEYVLQLNQFNKSVLNIKDPNSTFSKISNLYKEKNSSEIFDNIDEDFYLNYSQPFIKSTIASAKLLKQKLDLIQQDASENFSDFDKLYLTMLYVSKVYLAISALHALFWDDEESLDERNNELNYLTTALDENISDQAFALLSKLLLSQYVAEANELEKNKNNQAQDGNTETMNQLKLKVETIYNIEAKTVENLKKLEELLELFYNLSLEQNGDKYYLKSTPMGALRRDSNATILINTPHHYLRGVKLKTIGNMLESLNIKNRILGQKKEQALPSSCQKASGANLPEKIKMEIGDEESILENKLAILEQNGLLKTSTEFRDYYLEYENVLPSESSFSQLLNFERSFNSYVALGRYFPNQKTLAYYYGYNDGEDPKFDDVSDFPMVLELKKNKLFNLSSSEIKKNPQLEEEFQAMMTSLFSFNESAEQEIDGKTFTADTEGLNNYLIEKMKQKQISNWEEIVPESVKNIARQNIIRFDFPSLYSSDYWRRFAFNQLAQFFKSQENSSNKKTEALLADACRLSNKKTPICNEYKNNIPNLINRVNEDLKIFLTDHSFLPKINFDEKSIHNNFSFYKGAWNILQQNKLLPASSMNEWDFLKGQIPSYNSWATLRLSYLIFTNEAEESTLKEKVKNSLETLGMQHKLTPFHANNPFLLNKKENIILWQNILSEANNSTYNLFSTINPEHNKNYYQLFREVNDLTLISEADIKNAYNKFSSTNISTSKLTKSFSELVQSPQFSSAEILYSMYENQNNTKKLTELSNKLYDDYGIDGSTQIKETFLDIDSGAKLPLYLHMLEAAAQYNKSETLDALELLCDLNPKIDGRADFSELFHMTKNAQIELTKDSINPVAIPEDVEKKANWWSEKDWTEFKYGMLSGGFFGLATILTSLGAGVGVVAGLTLGSPLILTTMGLALAYQLLTFKSSLTQYFDSKVRKEHIDKLAKLGFTDNEGAAAIERSIGWTALEAFFIFPMIGTAGKSASLFSRALFNKFELGQATRQGEILHSQFIAGMRGINRGQLLNPKKLFSGLYDELIRPVATTAEKNSINSNVAKTIANYYGNDAGQFNKFLDRYYNFHRKVAKRILKVVGPSEKIAQMQSVNGSNKIINFIKTAPQRSRNYIATREEKIINLGGKIKQLQTKLASSTKNGESLEKFLADNADQLDDFFQEVPFALQEIPYLVLVQGAPASRGSGQLLGGMGRFFSEISYMKRVLSARKVLIFETMKANARASLSIKEGTRLHKNSYTLYRQFEKSLLSLRETLPPKEFANIENQMEATRSKLIVIIKGFYQKNGKSLHLSNEELFQTLFSPEEGAQVAMAETIWNAVPPKILLGIDQMGDWAKEILRASPKTGKTKNLVIFERKFSALKILHLQTNPELYGTM